MGALTCPNNPAGVAFKFRWITTDSSKRLSFLSQCLGNLVLASLLLCSANAYSNSAIFFNVKGLEGVSATVTALEDETGQAGLSEVNRRTDFKSLSDTNFQPVGVHPTWLRIDLEVPPSLVGQTAWLEVSPPYIYDVRFYQAGMADQRSGIGQNFSAHSASTLVPTFSVVLNQPTTRVYFRLYGAAFQAAQLQLLSHEDLHRSQLRAAQVNAFFFCVLLLMLMVNLLNWVWMRDVIYRSYAGFLASTVSFFLLSNNYVAAYVLQDQAVLALPLLKLSASCVLTSMVFFSLKIMQLEMHLPRLARGLKGLAWLLVISNLIVFFKPWAPRLFQINAFCYLLVGLLLLVISAFQAWKIRSTQALLIFVTFLLYTVMDKIQILSQFGLMPMIEWGLDIRKMAYLILVLPMHALLVAQLRQQKREKSAAQLLAAAAQQQALSARQQGDEVARLMALLGECCEAIVLAKVEKQMLDSVCGKICQNGQFQQAWIGLAKPGEDLQNNCIAGALEQVGEMSSARKALETGFTQIDHSVASIPVVHQAQVMGVMVAHTSNLRGFSQAEVRLLEEISRQMAFGLQTLRVQTELAQHQMHLEDLVQARTREIAVLNVDLTRKKEDAEVANRAKDDFISNLSHELRTPLNAVLGLTRLLGASTLNPRQRDYLEKIQLSGKVLRTLIDDILDFSKIKAKGLKLDPVPFSLDVLLTSLTSVLGVGIGHKPIEPLLDVAADVPDALIGDGLRLQQILLNFISNAVKFTHHGDIALSVQRLPAAVRADRAQVRLQFSVRDTGIGMSDETRQLIFNGFTQADASTSRLYGGTGLGLTISAQLATLMGGEIEVSSTLGQGSEFKLTVPLTLGHRAARPLQTLGAPGYRVLIMASHPVARQYVAQTCQRLGWQATVLDSATAGLQALRRSATENAYDLMLLDWKMPETNGADLLRQAQAEPGCRLPALILMTPIVDLEQVAGASAQFSPQAILAKPLMSRSLLEAASSALAGRSANSVVARPSPLFSVPRLKQMRLLVAEDNALNQEVIEHILTQAGAQVVLASDGQAAVAALQMPGAYFDAVLMDIQMPVMDGYAATHQIRAVLGLVDLPIIAMTAHARPQDREKSRMAGMVGHLVKPLQVDDLLDILVRSTGSRTVSEVVDVEDVLS